MGSKKMVLQYMLSNPGLAKREITERKTKAKQTRTKRKVLICLLLLAYLVVGNMAYNLWVAEENTPVWKLLTASIVYDLWTPGKNTTTKAGAVTGILYSKENPCALINHKLVYEGQTTNGIKVVKIDRHKVEFEKNGKRWTQTVLADPNSTWKKTK